MSDPTLTALTRLIAAFHGTEAGAVDELIADEFVLHPNALLPAGARGPAGIAAAYAELRAALPDARLLLDHLTSDGSTAVAHLVLQGSNPTTGGTLDTRMLCFWRFDGARAVEAWWYPDTRAVRRGFERPAARHRPLSAQEERVRQLVGRILNEYFNEGSLDVIPELFHPDFTIYAADGSVMYGHEGAAAYVTAEKAAFPDLYWRQEELMVDGDRATLFFTGYGTFLGEWMGIPPNGRAFTWVGNATFYVRDGKVWQDRLIWESARFMQQLGVLPEPELPQVDAASAVRVVEALHRFANKGGGEEVPALTELVAPAVLGHPGGRPDVVTLYGTEQFRSWFDELCTALPDLNVTIEQTVVHDNLVAVRWSATASHRGPYRGVQPSGDPLELTGASLCRVDSDGRVAQVWFVPDTAALDRWTGLQAA